MTSEKMNHRRDKGPSTKKRQEAEFQVEVILTPVSDAQHRLARAFDLVLRTAAKVPKG